jgi:hypothetical protein
MLRYLVFFSIGLYLTLLIGGQDNGQMRAGLRGAYAINLAPPVTVAQPSPTQDSAPATLASAVPADTIRVLPAADQPSAQPASLTSAPLPAEPAVATLNTPTVLLRTITAEAANVRAEASRNGAVIGRVERGEIVQMVEAVGDWVHIRIEGDGIDGFVHRRLISEEAPSLGNATLFPTLD